jgi:hypothetical protein
MKRQRNFSNMKSKRKRRFTECKSDAEFMQAMLNQQRYKEAFKKSYFGSVYVNRDEDGK